jgi:hypothetical protein
MHNVEYWCLKSLFLNALFYSYDAYYTLYIKNKCTPELRSAFIKYLLFKEID